MDSANKGIIAENYVALELARRGYNPFRISGNGEIDILTLDGLRLEVKSSAGTKPSSRGSIHFPFNFTKKQVEEVAWRGEKSDYCICVAFDIEYKEPLFVICIPTCEIRKITTRGKGLYYNIGVKYDTKTGKIAGTNNIDYSQYINNWDIIK